MDECFVIFHEYTDEFGFFEKEFIEVCATEPVAEAEVSRLESEMPKEGDIDYDEKESYYYQKEQIVKKRKNS